MTIASQVAIEQYNTDGATNNFAWPNSLFALADLNVVLFNPATGLALTPAPQFNGGGPNDYTVTGAQDAQTGEYLGGVTVAFNTVQAAGLVLTLTDGLAPTQQTSLSNNAPFPAKAIEAAFDRLGLLMQRTLHLIGLAPSVPDYDVVPGSLSLQYPPAAERANTVCGWDVDGNAIVLPMPPSVGGTLRVTDQVTVINNAMGLVFEGGGATVSVGGNPQQAVVTIPAPPNNKFDDNYQGYSIDRSFDPPLIEQWMTAGATAQNSGLTTFTLYYPVAFPTRALVQALTLELQTTTGEPTGWDIAETDLKTYCTINVYNADPGTQVIVTVLLKGF